MPGKEGTVREGTNNQNGPEGFGEDSEEGRPIKANEYLNDAHIEPGELVIRVLAEDSQSERR